MKKVSVLLGAIFVLIPFGAGVQSLCAAEREVIFTCLGLDTNILDGETDGFNTYSSTPTEFSPLVNYYYNLRFNHGYNQAGSCGYVALGMLLTYYDSYFNDDIVPEQFDCPAEFSDINYYDYIESPGSYRDEIFDISREDFSKDLKGDKEFQASYASRLINEFSSISLHAKLVELGYTNGYGLGLKMGNVGSILDLYFQYNSNIDKSKWEVNEVYYSNFTATVPGKSITYSTQMYDAVKDRIKRGIPTIVYICKADQTSGHVVVAYDYNAERDEIYANFGYGGRSSQYPLLFGPSGYDYEYVVGYVTLITHNSHMHSNNYIIGGVETCSCKLPNHVHNYTYKYKNATSHNCICYCENTYEAPHNFRVVGKNWVCSYCNYSKPYDGGFGPGIIWGLGKVEV